MLFHKKEKALEGQQAGTKPEKPRKVRWSERREPSEAGLERFQDYLQTYSTNKDHPIKILCSFYKGKQKKLVETGFFLILQRSPIWIIPIATSNIINAATNPDAGSLEIILLNVMVALLFIMQNAGTNYLATVAFASVNRGIDSAGKVVFKTTEEYTDFMDLSHFIKNCQYTMMAKSRHKLRSYQENQND